jgi:hypothetical protein
MGKSITWLTLQENFLIIMKIYLFSLINKLFIWKLLFLLNFLLFLLFYYFLLLNYYYENTLRFSKILDDLDIVVH